jgi:hypothetical protein
VRSRIALVALLLLTVLAACGKGDVKPASSGDPTTSTTEAEAETPTTEAEAEDEADEGDDEAAATELSFTGTEYAYAGVGDAGAAPIPAGDVTVTLTNDGAEEHQISIARLREGKTMEDLAAIGDDPTQLGAVLETFGGPNAVAPGATVSSVSTLPAGEFLFMCFIPAPDGVPHAVKGMLMPVTVEGDGGTESTFEGEGDPLAMGDFTFGLGTAEEPAEIGASDDFWLTNDGTQPHEAAIYTVAEGATNEDVVAYFSDPNAEASGPPPMVAAGGIGPIDPGRFARVALEPGDYVFICFIPDAADGAPHFVKGMLEFATVA